MAGVNLSRWAVQRPTLMLFLMIAISLTGVYSYMRLGRAEDPSFTIKVAVVTASWPGATATEIRDQVADLMEKKLQELPFLDKIESYTKPGFLAMQVTFKDTTPPKDVPQLFYQLRKKLDDIAPTLPAGVRGPQVNDEYGDVDTVMYAVTGDGADYHVLDKVVQTLRQRLLAVQDVIKVDVYGDQGRRIFVEFSEAKLASLAIQPQAVFDSLSKQNAINDAGVFETSSNRVRVQVTSDLKGADAIAAIPIEANGKVIRLGDIANVYAGFEDPPSFLARFKGQPAIVVGVVMGKAPTSSNSARTSAQRSQEIRDKTPVGIDIDQIADQPKVVEEAIGEFTRSFLEALVIVLGVSFLSLGFRTGIVVALSVPLVLAIVFIFMGPLGIDLQRISLGALIIALGLLVDDAIIAVEMMMVKMEQGFNRIKAATFAWEFDGLSDAHGDACHRCRLPAGRLRQFRSGRIYGFDVLGVAGRADRLMVCRGDVHALSRREASSRFRQAASASRSGGDLSDALLSLAPRRRHLGGRLSRRGDRRRDRRFRARRLRLLRRAEAVLPLCRAPGALPPVAPSRRFVHRRFARGRETGRGAPQGRSGRGALHELCRTGAAAVLARPQSAAPE